MLVNLALAVDLTSQVFWRNPFVSLCEQRQLIEYFVLQIEPVGAAYTTSKKVSGWNVSGTVDLSHLPFM